LQSIPIASTTGKDLRKVAGFLGDRALRFERPPPPHHRTRQPPAPPQDDDNDAADALAYHNEEAKDDAVLYVSCVFRDWQAAIAEVRKFNFPPP
jgi:hypothetical protein